MMENIDQYLQEQLQKDNLANKPSDKVHQNLQNKVLIKKANSSLKLNSIVPPFTTVFGKKHLAWKISAAAILLLSVMGMQQMNYSKHGIFYADSTQVQMNYDTLNLQVNDSSFMY